MPKYEMGKARALVARFETRLRAQSQQSGGKRRGEAAFFEGRQEGSYRSPVRQARCTRKGGRGRPRKQV